MMKHLQRGFSFVTILAILSMSCSVTCGDCPNSKTAQTKSTETQNWIPKDPQTFLKMLRAKDASFDNLSATTQRHKIVTRNLFSEYMEDSFSAYKWGGDPPPRPPDEVVFQKSFEVHTIATDTLTIRGQETTMSRLSIFDGRGQEATPPHFSKSSDSNGVKLILSKAGNHTVLFVDSSPLDPDSSLNGSRRNLEFCYGVGFGKRIQSISSITPQGDMALVKAKMHLWKNDTTTAELVVDRNLIVRKATLLTKKKDAYWLIESTATGIIKVSGQRTFSKAGSYKQELTNLYMKNGVQKTRTHVQENFSTTDHQVKPDLNDADYEALVFIDQSGATSVIDLTPRPKKSEN